MKNEVDNYITNRNDLASGLYEKTGFTPSAR